MALCPLPAAASSAPRITAHGWHIWAENAADDRDVARLCFQKNTEAASCHKAIYHPKGAQAYRFQTITEITGLKHPDIVRAAALFDGGGSGTLTQLWFWYYDRKTGRFVDAGQFTLSNQSEYTFTPAGIFISADALWQQGETHFSPHHFQVRAYRYSATAGFTLAVSYATKTRYPSYDDVAHIDVLSHEMPEIKQRLARKP